MLEKHFKWSNNQNRLA